MKYGFNVYQTEVDEHVFWVAESKDLNGCVGQGDTVDEAIKELEENEVAWLETAEEFGIKIPKQSIEAMNNYSGKFTVRISPYVHKETVEQAKKHGISLNQYVNDAIVTRNAGFAAINGVKDAVEEFKGLLHSYSKARQYKSSNVVEFSYKEPVNVSFADLKIIEREHVQ